MTVGAASVWTTRGRQQRSARYRLTATFSVIAGLHLVAVGFLLFGGEPGPGMTTTVVGGAVFAYTRGLLHSVDFDHVSMIDNTTRKFVAEGRRPVAVGMAFSAGHSTVVVATGVLVVSGAGVTEALLDPGSTAAAVLGGIGLTVSGVYLFLVGMTNLPTLIAACRLRRRMTNQPPGQRVPMGVEVPRPGLAVRLLAGPLRGVRHPRHVFVVGLLFGLGFDTASTIGLLMVTAASAAAGTSPLVLLSFPLLFAAAMTLGDTVNGLLMLRLYVTAQQHSRRAVTFDIIVTGLSVTAAITVAVLATAALLTGVLHLNNPLLDAVAGVDAAYLGIALVAVFAGIGVAALIRTARRRPRPST